MTTSIRRTMAMAAVALVAVLAFGAATAGAHRGPRPGLARAGATALVTEAAKQLSVTPAALVAAIDKSATAAIDDAVADGDVDADRAADLKAKVPDNLGLAMALSRTRTVASNLGITTAKLNTGFRAARKTLILARIDKALADGDITADQAAQLKQKLDSIQLPGYKAGFGFGGRHH